MQDKVIVPACFPKYPIFEDEVASNGRIVGPGGTFNSGVKYPCLVFILNHIYQAGSLKTNIVFEPVKIYTDKI